MKRLLPLTYLLLLAAALPAVGQGTPPGSAPAAPPGEEAKPVEPAAEALLYERDFDLLLEEAGVPTAGQVALDEELASFADKRLALARREADLQKRLETITGSFTLVAAAEEMTRQGVSDVRKARENLQRELLDTKAKLALLDRKEAELKERRAR